MEHDGMRAICRSHYSLKQALAFAQDTTNQLLWPALGCLYKADSVKSLRQHGSLAHIDTS
eukprot:scaffold623809_cov15-Prasinocladus_malaysianus.AAC.1